MKKERQGSSSSITTGAGHASDKREQAVFLSVTLSLSQQMAGSHVDQSSSGEGEQIAKGFTSEVADKRIRQQHSKRGCQGRRNKGRKITLR